MFSCRLPPRRAAQPCNAHHGPSIRRPSMQQQSHEALRAFLFAARLAHASTAVRCASSEHTSPAMSTCGGTSSGDTVGTRTRIASRSRSSQGKLCNLTSLPKASTNSAHDKNTASPGVSASRRPNLRAATARHKATGLMGLSCADVSSQDAGSKNNANRTTTAMQPRTKQTRSETCTIRA